MRARELSQNNAAVAALAGAFGMLEESDWERGHVLMGDVLENYHMECPDECKLVPRKFGQWLRHLGFRLWVTSVQGQQGTVVGLDALVLDWLARQPGEPVTDLVALAKMQHVLHGPGVPGEDKPVTVDGETLLANLSRSYGPVFDYAGQSRSKVLDSVAVAVDELRSGGETPDRLFNLLTGCLALCGGVRLEVRRE